MMRLVGAILALVLSLGTAQAMHVGDCPAPNIGEIVATTDLPPGIRAKVAEDPLGALGHAGTVKQLLKNVATNDRPALLTVLMRLHPELARKVVLTDAEKSAIRAATTGEVGACLETYRALAGELRTAIARADHGTSRTIRTVTTDMGQTIRVNGLPGSVKLNGRIKVKGWQVGHDLLADLTGADETLTVQTWSAYERPNAPTTGELIVNVVGFTYDGDTNPPTIARMTEQAAEMTQLMRESSDPDGDGPLPPDATIRATVHPTIIDATGIDRCANYTGLARMGVEAFGGNWKRGDTILMIGNFGCGWGGLGYLNAVDIGVGPLVRGTFAITNARSCTWLHEVMHGMGGGHANSVWSCQGIIPGMEEFQDPCTVQPYGDPTALGYTSICAPPPLHHRELWGWTINCIENPAMGTHRVRSLTAGESSQPWCLKIDREPVSGRADDVIYISGHTRVAGDARLPIAEETGARLYTRCYGNRWINPCVLDGGDTGSGHARDHNLDVGRSMTDPITGVQITTVAEGVDWTEIRLTAGTVPPPPTTSTTTSTLPPVGVERVEVRGPVALASGERGTWRVVHVLENGSETPGDECRWQVDARGADESPDLAAFSACVVESSMMDGINWLHAWSQIAGAWVQAIPFPLVVTVGSTTTTLAPPPTSTTSTRPPPTTSTSSTSSTLPPSTSSTSSSSSTSTSSSSSTSSSTSSSSTTVRPTTVPPPSTTSTTVAECSMNGQRCRHARQCRAGTGDCAEYKCGRKWWRPLRGKRCGRAW